MGETDRKRNQSQLFLSFGDFHAKKRLAIVNPDRPKALPCISKHGIPDILMTPPNTKTKFQNRPLPSNNYQEQPQRRPRIHVTAIVTHPLALWRAREGGNYKKPLAQVFFSSPSLPPFCREARLHNRRRR